MVIEQLHLIGVFLSEPLPPPPPTQLLGVFREILESQCPVVFAV
jgi:hypothetical protein